MNYLALIIFFILFLFLINKNTKKYLIDVKQTDKKINVKNKLLYLLDEISSADKLYLKNITNRWIYNKNTMDNDLNKKVMNILKKPYQS